MQVVIFCIILFVIIVLITIALYLEHHKEKLSWTGTLEDKKIHDYFYNGHYSNLYIIYIRKENGERVTFSVTESLYNSFEPGDKVKKGKGEYFPTVMSQ